MDQQRVRDYFVGKYNYSRRVVDHRIPADLNFSVNAPFGTQLWWKAAKQRLIGVIMNKTGFIYSTYGVGLALAILGFDAVIRSQVYDGVYKSQLDVSRQPYGHVFYHNYRNQDTNLGRWNTNFYCFENQPGCGDDVQ